MEIKLDIEDRHLLDDWQYYTFKNRSTTYVRLFKGKEKTDLHRAVMHARPGDIVDHINHDGLDNRRSNLRIVNNSLNALNAKRVGGRRGMLPGVNKAGKKFMARLMVNGKSRYLGLFETEQDAHQAYEDAKRPHL